MFGQRIGPRCPRFRLSHAGSAPAGPSRGPPSLRLDGSHRCSSWVFSPKRPEWPLATDSFLHFSVPGPELAVYAISCRPTSRLLRGGALLTFRVGAALFQVSSLLS